MAGAALGPLSASASTTASISGVVAGADAPGAGLADVDVALTLAGGTQVDFTSTDSTGAYSFTGLQAATYLVQFSDDYNTGHLGATSSPLVLADGQSLSNVNGSLAVGGSISGRISLSTGSLTQPASVALVGQGADVTDPGDLFFIGTAPDGKFTFTGVSAGSYTLAFEAPYGSDWAPQYWSGSATLTDATYFTVTAGQTASNKNAVLQPGSSVSGTVTGSGAPVSFGFVQAIGADGIADGNAMTASDGSYTVTGLPVGSQTLKFMPPFSANFVPQWWSGASTAADAQYFDVPADGALTGYDADLVAGATISGTIKDAEGNPIPFASAYARNGGDVFGTGGFANGAGNYSITGLSAGDYTVQFDASGAGGYESGWWDGASDPATATVLHVGAQQQVTGIDSALGAGATISGTVSGLTTGGVSFAAANATITAVRPDGSQASQVYADESGAYTVANLPAG
ncbi:MAG TPA: carboxypeptidase-like regulatory domain-containing protein, partial [Pseudolysinimonas sp.]